MTKVKDRELVYAATARCLCGAGLAYAPGSPDRCWDCSDILTGRAIPSGHPGAVQHSDTLAFVFYKVTSEKELGPQGPTTRPQGGDQ